MSPLGLAWRTATREPARALLGIAGITAVGALLFNMLLLSRGLLVSFHDLLDSVAFDVRVTATEALPTQGPPLHHVSELAHAIRALPEVSVCAPFRIGVASAVRPDGSLLEVALVGSEPEAESRRTWTVLRGRGLANAPVEVPGAPGSILVNEQLARELSLEPGSLVRIIGAAPAAVSALPAKTLRVAGIVSLAFQGSGEPEAVVTLEQFRGLVGSSEADNADLLLIASSPGSGPAEAVEAIRRLRSGLHVFSNEEFMTRFSSTDFSYFRQISFVLSTITLSFAFLLVATLLTVAVNQRFGEVAALRAIGFSRRRVAADLLAESALLVLSGALLSIPVGALLSVGLDAILRSMPGFPERLHFFVFDARAVLAQLGLLALVGFAATLYPIALAVRLPIAATLRKEVVS